METSLLSNKIKEKYLKHLEIRGEYGLYKCTVGNALNNWAYLKQSYNPDIELLNISDGFFALSRSTGDKNYFIIGRALRKAAHKLYRILNLLNNNRKTNIKFLNIVEK